MLEITIIALAFVAGSLLSLAASIVIGSILRKADVADQGDWLDVALDELRKRRTS